MTKEYGYDERPDPSPNTRPAADPAPEPNRPPGAAGRRMGLATKEAIGTVRAPAEAPPENAIAVWSGTSGVRIKGSARFVQLESGGVAIGWKTAGGRWQIQSATSTFNGTLYTGDAQTSLHVCAPVGTASATWVAWFRSENGGTQHLGIRGDGRVVIGTGPVPDAWLTIRAGGSVAPLRLEGSVGLLLGPAFQKPGNIEYDGSSLLVTTAGPTRKRLVNEDRISWPSLVLSKLADESRTNTTVLAVDSTFTFAVAAGDVYQFEMVLAYNSTAVAKPGLKCRIEASAGNMTGWWKWIGSDDPTNALLSGQERVSGATTSTVDAGTNVIVPSSLKLEGELHFSAAGLFRFFWAQVLADAAPTILLRGSVLKTRRVNPPPVF